MYLNRENVSSKVIKIYIGLPSIGKRDIGRPGNVGMDTMPKR
jgi:hypothetical protein